MKRWQLQEAKNRLSAVVKRTRSEGPQAITVHGEDAAVVMSIDEYRKLTKPPQDLASFLRESPLFAVDLDIQRDGDTGRETEL